MTQEIRPFEVYKGKIRRKIKLSQDEKVYMNLLSVYDMLLCERMAKTLVLKLLNEGFERPQATSVAENACLCVMCLTDANFEPLFTDTSELMEKLTAEDILAVVRAYNALRKDYLGFDELSPAVLDSVKKN